MGKKKTAEMIEGEMLSNQPENIVLEETVTEVNSIVEKPGKEIYIRPGFILIKHKETGGTIVVAESQFGRIYATEEWEQITDLKKK